MPIPQIPETHIDLIDGPYTVVLTTVMPDGQPQTTPIWCNREGEYVLINTMRDFRKYKNMKANPKITLIAFSVKKPLHNIEVRGIVVEMTEDGAEEHLDALTQLYMNRPDARFFGDCIAEELRATHVPVRVKIAPTRVRVEG